MQSTNERKLQILVFCLEAFRRIGKQSRNRVEEEMEYENEEKCKPGKYW